MYQMISSKNNYVIWVNKISEFLKIVIYKLASESKNCIYSGGSFTEQMIFLQFFIKYSGLQ